jgi:hypothetical protein
MIRYPLFTQTARLFVKNIHLPASWEADVGCLTYTCKQSLASFFRSFMISSYKTYGYHVDMYIIGIAAIHAALVQQNV